MAKTQSGALDAVLADAQAHIERKEYADAEKKLKAIIKSDSKCAGAYFGLAGLARATNHHAHAIPLFQEALRLEPGNSTFREALARQLVVCGHPSQAREVLAQGLKIDGSADNLQAMLSELDSGGAGEPSDAVLSHMRALAAREQYGDLLAFTRSLLGDYENDARVRHYHGMALLYSGAPAEAAREFEYAVQRQPNYDEAWGQLGIARMHLRKPGSSIAAHERAINLKPGESTHYINAALCYFEFGQYDLCDAHAREALALKGDSAPAITLIAKVATKRWEYEKANLLARKALEINPNYHPAQAALVDLLLAEGKLKETEWECRRLIAMKPDKMGVYNTIVDSLMGQQKYDESLRFAEMGVGRDPSNIPLQNRLAISLHNSKRYKDALDKYQEILEVAPEYFPSRVNLAGAFSVTGEHQQSMDVYADALQMPESKPEHYSNRIFATLYDPLATAETILKDSKDWAREHYGESEPFSSWDVETAPDAPLRIGLISGDFRNHPVGFFLESVLRELMGKGVEVCLYSTVLAEDETTQRFKELVTHWRKCYKLSPSGLAEEVRADKVQILIDVAGHTAHNRLSVFAKKPAPVQITWLGYLSTTGLDTVDYIIGDPWVTPAGEEHHFTETPLVLPSTYQCLSKPTDSPDVNDLPAMTNGYITFGSFNNFAKLNDPVVEVWAKVLLAVPGSRLLLKNQVLTDPFYQEKLRQRFAKHGVEADRLMFEASRSREHILESYGRVDIGLDPFPYTGCTTSFESLWMGVPVVSRRGDRFLSHAGESILNNLGLPDWIAGDSEEYVQLAAAKAADLESLAEVRAGLRDRVLASPLMDAQAFASDMHDALSRVWSDWLDNLPVQKTAELDQADV